MRTVFLVAAAAGVTHAQLPCNLDADCAANSWCRIAAPNSVFKMCQPYVSQGQPCKVNDLQSWDAIKCSAGTTCTPLVGAIPAAGVAYSGVCMVGNTANQVTVQAIAGAVCGANPAICGASGFCKQSAQNSNIFNCAPLADIGQACTYGAVVAWMEQPCLPTYECRPSAAAGAGVTNQGTCQLRGTGRTCAADTDCASSSLFCKRVSQQSSVKECFKRGVQGERCNRPGFVAEWDTLSCLDTLTCALLDNNNPGLGGTCHTRGTVCLHDQDCGSISSFCRRISATSFTKQCYTKAIVGERCTLSSYTPEWEMTNCASDLECVEIDVNNPNLQGSCMPRRIACTNDLDCATTQFCKRASSTSSHKQCFDRSILNSQCSSAGFVPEWNEKKCLSNLRCSLISTSNPALGGYCRNMTTCNFCDTIASPVCANGEEYFNSCFARCEGISVWQEGPCNAQGCVADNDCKSDSFFCKRAMISSSFKSCFLRSTEGQPCTWPGYATDWNERKCLEPGLFCVLNDPNTPGLGGTCQAQQSGCSVDSDCRSSSQFCKRVSANSAFKSCFERSTQSQDCTIGTSVPEWNVKECLATLYCYPLNYNNPSAGGVCQSNTFYGSNGPNPLLTTPYQGVAIPPSGQFGQQQLNSALYPNVYNQYNTAGYTNNYNTAAYPNNNNSPTIMRTDPVTGQVQTVANPYYNPYYNNANNINANSPTITTTNPVTGQVQTIANPIYNQNYNVASAYPIAYQYPTQYNYNTNTNSPTVTTTNPVTGQVQTVANPNYNPYYNNVAAYPTAYSLQVPTNYYPQRFTTAGQIMYPQQAPIASAAYFTCSRGCYGEGVPDQNGRKCYCDSQCVQGNDCCPDYQQFCASGYRSNSNGSKISFTSAIKYSRATPKP